jgi:p-cumate 2,3-dioxygenase subunit alpha
LESCQRGFAAQPDVAWSDISRGMTRVPKPDDEMQIRTFWRAWASILDDAGLPDQIVDVESPQVDSAVRS